ncbi:hypothetical protein VitviT2T_011831 [Vitis vinifera]|uniref:Uncharacterized protein n=2 Tax=Vitis vinifera TaxID=29760 RepID=A0ABY9CCW3_VITVI|eukprot:XP_010653398.1 PREDICTED: uncharacterized protein LOC104880017 [Vitis vinifera]
MEDGVTDSERLVLPSKLNSKVGAKQEEANDFEPEKNEKDEERAGGLISNLISNLVPRSVAEAGEEDNGGDTENRNRISEGKDEEKEGGFINHLISNLVSPLSPRPREVNEGKVEVENGEKSSDDGGWWEKKVVMEGGGGSAGGGGLINNLISNIFNQSDEDGVHKEDSEEEKAHIGEQNEQVKGKEEGGGGGIIKNLVSHLPASLSEDAAPTADEASILIHSIVHD